MRDTGDPPPLPQGRLRQVDLDAAVEEIIQGLHKGSDAQEVRVRRHVDQAFATTLDRLYYLHDRTETRTAQKVDGVREVAERLEKRLADIEVALGMVLRATTETGVDAHLALTVGTNMARRVEHVIEQVGALVAIEQEPMPSAFEAEMEAALREFAADIPAHGADNVIPFPPASKTGGFDTTASPTKALKRTNP